MTDPVAQPRGDAVAGEPFDPRRSSFLDHRRPEPTLAEPTAQLCTQAQFAEPAYARWCAALREPPSLRRKQWEFVWILETLERGGMLAPGRRGLGFGCGREPLAAVMAQRGCEIVATDLAADAAKGLGWIETGQHAAGIDDLNDRGICEPALFRRRVRFENTDMNAIPPHLTGFDFVWSSCAFEHLGSIAHGQRFVVNAMRCLEPGGIAVHTTEFNLSSNFRTIEAPDLVVYRRSDIERLYALLGAAGHAVSPLNLNPGSGELDRHVDLPPYRADPQLRLKHDQFVFTSLGIAVRCGAGTIA